MFLAKTNFNSEKIAEFLSPRNVFVMTVKEERNCQNKVNIAFKGQKGPNISGFWSNGQKGQKFSK